jgi:hypothetical protein
LLKTPELELMVVDGQLLNGGGLVTLQQLMSLNANKRWLVLADDADQQHE